MASVLQVHPVAEMFPLIEGDDYQSLVEDVKRHGVREPVWLHPDGSIIDGRNRARAAADAGVHLPTRTWDGTGSLVELVLSLNLHRRHLTKGQCAVLALAIKPMLAAEAKQRQRHGGPDAKGTQIVEYLDRNDGAAAQQAAKLTGTNRQYVADAQRISDERPDLLEQVRDGSMSIPEAKRELRREANKAEANRLRQEPMPLPTGKYAVIELDPPWSYEEQNLAAPGNRNAEDKYATMTLEEIRGLPIAELAADNAHIYLWTTANHLRHAWSLLESWGFEYRSLIVWHKPRIGMGHYYRNQAEFVLFGVRGKLPLLAHDKPNVFAWDAPRIHSIKPDGFYELVEECSPSPRIRLFARSQREGWDSWGNQA